MEKTVSPPSVGGDTRRSFLKKTAAATAAVAATGILKTPVYGQSSTPSTGRVIGANDRIAVAVIGVGIGIGQNHLTGIHTSAGANNVTLAAACDLYSVRRDFAKEKAELKEGDVYSDYRKILDRKDIDAVVVATHDPWHAPISIQAMESGKHVYCEKPMTRYLGEAFQVHDTVKKTGKIFQVGSQGCSAAAWHKAAEIIQSGKIGQLVWAQGYYCRNSGPNSKFKGEWNYDIDKTSTPENIDWNTWLGPVSKRPFSADAFHRWRKYFPYCSGLLGDLVPHRMHPLMLATGNPQFPVRVTSIGTKNVHSDKYTPGTPERDVAEHVQILAEFPNGALITVTCSTVNSKSPGFVIYGHHATLEIGSSGEKLTLVPEREWSEELDGIELTGLAPEDLRVHEKNWFDSIRANKQPNAGIDLAIKVQTVISLAEMSDRLKVTCLFDEKSRKITTENGRELKPITYGTLPLS
jgi:predicted dehydrogenase